MFALPGKRLTTGLTGRRRSPLIMPSSVASLVTTGDSITAGTAASAAGNRWANIVAAALGATLNNNGISGTVLQNSNGSGGSPLTNNLRDRYVTDLTGANKKSMVIIAYGLNDARYTGAPATMNLANFINDYREILIGLFSAGYTSNRVVLVSPHWFPDAGFASGGAGFTGQTRTGYLTYVAAVLALAKEFGTYYADTYTALQSAGAGVIDTDSIHPLDAGHGIIAAAVLAARMQITDAYAYDSFTADDGTLVSRRRGELGAEWALAAGYPVNPSPQIAASRLWNDQLSSVWRTSGLAPIADYEVVALFRCLSSIASENTGIFLRNNPNGLDRLYWGRFLNGTGWQLFKTVDGVSTQLGSTAGGTSLTVGQCYRVVVRAVGTTISLIVDNVSLVSVTDSAITAAGYGGVRMATVRTSTTGVHIEDFLARPVPIAA